MPGTSGAFGARERVRLGTLPAVDVEGGGTTLERAQDELEAEGERGRQAAEAARGHEARVEAGVHGDGVEDGGRFLATATHVVRGEKAAALASSRGARRETAKARASAKHVVEHARRRLDERIPISQA